MSELWCQKKKSERIWYTVDRWEYCNLGKHIQRVQQTEMTKVSKRHRVRFYFLKHQQLDPSAGTSSKAVRETPPQQHVLISAFVSVNKHIKYAATFFHSKTYGGGEHRDFKCDKMWLPWLHTQFTMWDLKRLKTDNILFILFLVIFTNFLVIFLNQLLGNFKLIIRFMLNRNCDYLFCDVYLLTEWKNTITFFFPYCPVLQKHIEFY